MIPKKLKILRVLSRAELITSVSGILGPAISRVIDTHNTESIIFIYEQNDAQLLLKAEFGRHTATHREIAWYQHAKKYRPNHKTQFIDSYSNPHYALLLLNYVSKSATIDELMTSKKASAETITAHIQKALNINRDIFDKTARDAGSAEIEVFYRNKYKQRRKEAGETPYLANLFSRPSVIINGLEYDTPDRVLHKIEASPLLQALLTPQKLGFIHGDLHCGNILTKGEEIFLIDPNGTLYMPIEYDLGKIFHSLHGSYGYIMRNQYTLTEQNRCVFDFTVETSSAYQAAFQALKATLSPQEYLRGLYAEALHFATMLPHHASVQEETTALFLRSVELFGNLMNEVRHYYGTTHPSFHPTKGVANTRK